MRMSIWLLFQMACLVGFGVANSLPERNGCEGILSSLDFKHLLSKVDWQQVQKTPRRYLPAVDSPLFSPISHELALARYQNKLPFSLTSQHRVIETPIGPAVFPVDELRDFLLLESAVKSDTLSADLLASIARNRGYCPRGLHPRSCEWIWWSSFAKRESREIARRKGMLGIKSDHPLDDGLDRFSSQFLNARAEFRRLARQKNLFLFPFGTDLRYYESYQVAPHLSQGVLLLLARFQFFSHIYVTTDTTQKRLVPLVEQVGDDALVLISRVPALLPLFPLFEDGSIDIGKSGYTNEFLANDEEWHQLGEAREIFRADEHFLATFLGPEAKFLSVSMKADVDASYNSFSDFDRPSFNFSFDLVYGSDAVHEEDLDLTWAARDAIRDETLIALELLFSQKKLEFEKITKTTLPLLSISFEEWVEDDLVIDIGFSEDVSEALKAAFFMFVVRR